MTSAPSTTGRDIHTVPLPVGEPAERVDVLVVGAGPVGLAAAVELAGRGVDVAVVDRATQFTLVRAGAMGHTPRVVEHFRRWGLLQRIRDEWTVPPEWNRGIRLVTSLAGHELVPGAAPAFSAPRGRAYSSQEALRRPQTALQRVFLDRLAELGVDVVGGWELVAVADVGDGVDATLVDVASGRRRTVRTRFLIGADGGRSTVRSLAGINRLGPRANEKRVRLVVRATGLPARLATAPSATNIVVNPRASGFLAAVSADEWRVYAGPFPLDYEPDSSELLDVARAAFGVDLDLQILSATTFYDATRIAERFRSGRVLLAGDAAHVRTPGGNLGEGFGDVVNLGWKLAAVLGGLAPERLLDSYDEERRPHNQRVADHALARSARNRQVLDEIRRGGIPDDSDASEEAIARRTEIGRLLAAERSDGLGVTFDERCDASSAIWYDAGQDTDENPWQADVYEDDARPGHRAPNGYVDAYGGTLYDRIGGDFALVVLTEDRTLEHAFVAAAGTRSLPLTVVHLGEVTARQVYGAATVLVRPDQHVAWRGTELPDGGADAVLDRVLGGAAPTAVPPSVSGRPAHHAPELALVGA